MVTADVVTARAVSALSNLAGLTIPLLGGEGEVVAIKGRSAAEEIEKAAKIDPQARRRADIRGHCRARTCSKNPPLWCGS